MSMTSQQLGTVIYTWLDIQCVTSLSLLTLLPLIDCSYKLRQVGIDLRGFLRSQRTEVAFMLFRYVKYYKVKFPPPSNENKART